MTDLLVFTPADVVLSRSPLAPDLGGRTYVLGAFNPGLTRLPSGNLLLMVRVAEAVRDPVAGEYIRSIRRHGERYVLDARPLAAVDRTDPRTFSIADPAWKVLGLTSLSWLLPVELSPDGCAVVAVHYDRAVQPCASYQCYGIEDARISRVDGRWLMTTCSVGDERQCTALYSSPDAADWRLEGIVLDHQNKDMLIFEGRIAGAYWAQTRPLGDAWFAPPPGSTARAGASIQLASSPDALHWKPCDRSGLRPRTLATARIGGGAPPVLTRDGWLSLWHGVEPGGPVGTYRTYWSILDADDPSIVVRAGEGPLIEPSPALTAPLADAMYLEGVVFTTGIVDAGDHFIVASGEADLACRITHVPKSVFGLEAS